MRCGASVACAPLQNRQMAFFSRACPYPPAAALLCHLARGPLLHFRKSASGQSPPAGGPLAADLGNCTRRASRQLVSSFARAHALPGAQEICPGPPLPVSGAVPRPARTALGGPAARCAAAAAAGLQPAKRATGGLDSPGPGTKTGPLLRAGAACLQARRIMMDRRLGARPRENDSCRYARYGSTDARLAAHA